MTFCSSNKSIFWRKYGHKISLLYLINYINNIVLLRSRLKPELVEVQDKHF